MLKLSPIFLKSKLHLNQFFTQSYKTHPTLSSLILSGCLGMCMPLGFAPFYWWGLLPFVLAIWIMHIHTSPIPFQSGFVFGFCCFGFGLWWVSISMHQFGGASIVFALLGTALLAAILSLYYAILALMLARFKIEASLKIGVVFPLIWTLFELLRAHLFTGFPWLALGYSWVDSPFSAVIIPRMGALMGSIWVIWTGCLCALALINYRTTLIAKHQNTPSIEGNAPYYLSYTPNLILGLSLGVLMLGSNYFGTPITISQTPRQVSAIQGNIPQEIKFNPEKQMQTLNDYLALSEKVVQSSTLIVWPETALTTFYEDMPELYQHFKDWTKAHNTTLMLGAFRGNYDEGEYRNTIISINGIASKDPQHQAIQFYDKHRLLPFGEYMPLRALLGFFEKWVQIPMSNMTAGAAQQAPLITQYFTVGASICFEAVFGNTLRYQARHSDVLVNVSNDAWFGNSLAPWQHFQIARARAIEMARPMIRATNTGVTALVDHNGRVTKTIPIYTRGIVTGDIYPTQGLTPYVVLGDWPWLFAFLILLVGIPIFLKRNNTIERDD